MPCLVKPSELIWKRTSCILLFTLTSSRIRIITIRRWYDRNIMLEVHSGSSAAGYCCLWLDDRERLELTSIDDVATWACGKSSCIYEYNISSRHHNRLYPFSIEIEITIFPPRFVFHQNYKMHFPLALFYMVFLSNWIFIIWTAKTQPNIFFEIR